MASRHHLQDLPTFIGAAARGTSREHRPSSRRVARTSSSRGDPSPADPDPLDSPRAARAAA
jgi:hypothetical protein